MDSDPSAQILPKILLLLVLTLINAFFAASEIAIVSVNKNKIQKLSEDGDKRAKLVEKLISEPTNFLSTIQVAITLAGLFSSAIAAKELSAPFAKILESIGTPFSDTVSFVSITIILAFFNLVFGELVPKRIALVKAEAMSLFVVRPIRFIGKISFPFVKLLSFSTSLVLRLFGINSENLEEDVSEEEIRSMLASAKKSGTFNETEHEMLEGVFEFNDILAHEIMTPRTDVCAIDIDEPLEESLKEIMEMKHSRIPVYEDSIDNIIGILYIKDFIKEAYKVGFNNVNVRSVLRDAFFIPESKNIDILFKELQSNRKHIAILVDEYGGFSGIVTMEDLVEEIMGNIQDEFDEEEIDFQKIDDLNYILSGSYEITDLNEEFELELSEEEHETISGFLINELGYIPKDGEKPFIKTDNAEFYVLRVSNHRIQKVKMHLLPKEDEESDESEE
ncbi:hemolysin family protein [Peptostreptococcus faecalis]|uniref:hemolysin family protein n=1 Tax=Peptostreptococcus faecalis TaxID=2045015 RepID=UPI000C7A8AA3|nr:hemolysin family protein [Peptostreptococcus faecalis]